MPIPEFDENGLLPVGPHEATIAEIEQSLVNAFATSQRRRGIFEAWRIHREALRQFIEIDEQWLDGSFCEHKVDPGDMDLVTVHDGPKYDSLEPPQRLTAEFLMSGHLTREFWLCDCFHISMYPEDHPFHDASHKAVAYWQNWWSHLRDDDPRGDLPKGYVVVR